MKIKDICDEKELRKILEKLTFNKLEEWRKIPIQEIINQALSEIINQEINLTLNEQKLFDLMLLCLGRLDAKTAILVQALKSKANEIIVKELK